MAHGFSANKDVVADRYAEAFAGAVLAVLLSDHRGFGTSGGEPRQVSSPPLFVVSPDDEMVRSSPAVARDAYERLAGPKERVEILGGHFGLLYFPSAAFDEASSTQSQFHTETLLTEDE